MHEQFPEHDAAVLNWLDQQGWTVTLRNYDDREVFAWRAEGVEPNITLRITRSILEDHSPDLLISILERFKTAKRLAQAPSRYTLIKRSETGAPELVQLDEPPK